ncbi:MAG: hypothetical protein VR69_01515 [Peptococcaceae bacterium BRH_c4b]|nr:MAG: hypothetical protein VR69_01515 [Peptococcaceae bacterium BRH_c4b]
MAQKLTMSFRNTAGKTVTMSLADPRPDITAADVTTVMDAIIAKNVFSSSGGDLVVKERAVVIDTTENELYNAG